MVVECSSQQNASLTIINTEFHDMNITQDPTLYLYGVIPYLGVVHISARGLDIDCYQNLVLDNVRFYNVNFDKNLSDANYNITDGFNVPYSSAVTVDYDGPFNVQIKNSLFINMFSATGSAICLSDTNDNDNEFISITNNTFINCASMYEGGAIYNQNSEFTATQNTFQNTKSLVRAGGAIYSQELYPDPNILTDNTFNSTIRYYLYDFSEDLGVNSMPLRMKMDFDIDPEIEATVTEVNGSYFLNNISSDSFSQMNISVTLIDQFNSTIYDDYFRDYDTKGFSLVSETRTSNYRHCNLSTCVAYNPVLPLSGLANTFVPVQVVYTTIQ